MSGDGWLYFQRCPVCGAAPTIEEGVEDHVCPDPPAGPVMRGVAGILDDEAPCCVGADPTCPCADGFLCHYVDDPVTGTKAWEVQR